jgi:hypothetical protein
VSLCDAVAAPRNGAFQKEQSMSVGGVYECITKTPMGDQKGTLTVNPSDDGTSFTGTMVSSMGSTDVQDGKIDGNKISWKNKITLPMPMTLDCVATIDGDTLDGEVKAGGFGTMPFSGQRKA